MVAISFSRLPSRRSARPWYRHQVKALDLLQLDLGLVAASFQAPTRRAFKQGAGGPASDQPGPSQRP